MLLLFQDFFVFVLSLNDEHNVVIAKKKLIVSCNLIVGKSSSATSAADAFFSDPA